MHLRTQMPGNPALTRLTARRYRTTRSLAHGDPHLPGVELPPSLDGQSSEGRLERPC